MRAAATMVLCLLFFCFGLYLGELIFSRKAAPELELCRACLERMGMVNAITADMADAITEVNREKRLLLMGSGPLCAGHEPGMHGMPEKFTGKGGR